MKLHRAVLCLMLAAPAWAAPDLFPAVLTDNAVGDEPAIPTGVTYTATPAYDNPADKSGRRLLDRDQPWDDWNVTVGLNQPEQTVTFDLHGQYRLSRFGLRMTQPAKPASVTITVAETDQGPWLPAAEIVPAKMTPEGEEKWYNIATERPVSGRLVRMHFKIADWGWYVKEAKIWGVRADEPGPEVAVPHLMAGKRLVLARGARPAASLILAHDAAPDLVAAARFVQTTIRQMTGATLPLRDDARDWPGGQILVGPSRLNSLTIAQGPDAPQRYRLRVAGRSVALAGNDAAPFHGTRDAAYALLWELGCGWFGPDELYHVIPRTAEPALDPMDREETPDFDYRSVWNVFPEAASAWRLGGPPVASGHAYDSIIPPGEYFEKHPEYFALVSGKRTAQAAQICFANPDVQRITVEKARKTFAENPAALTYSLSANDCGGLCECPECAKLGENPGARTLAFANLIGRQLAQTNPGKLVCFLAYWYTFAAPAQIKAEPNVMVMVVNQGCHAHALQDRACPANVGWSQNFDKWAATGAKLAIYEWYIPGCSHTHWQRLPWVSPEVAFANLKYWRAKGVRWITYESQTAYEQGTGYPRRWPLYYMAAQGLWDCDADPRRVLGEACARLYGPAGPAMARVYQTMADAMAQTKIHSGIWNLPAASIIYRPEVRTQIRGLFAAALAAAQPDSLAWQRVVREADLWRESETTLAALPEPTQHMVDARAYNGGIWYTDQDQVTGALLRDLVGIGAGEKLVVTAGKQQFPLEDKHTYTATGGLQIAPAGKH